MSSKVTRADANSATDRFALKNTKLRNEKEEREVEKLPERKIELKKSNLKEKIVHEHKVQDISLREMFKLSSLLGIDKNEQNDSKNNLNFVNGLDGGEKSQNEKNGSSDPNNAKNDDSLCVTSISQLVDISRRKSSVKRKVQGAVNFTLNKQPISDGKRLKIDENGKIENDLSKEVRKRHFASKCDSKSGEYRLSQHQNSYENNSLPGVSGLNKYRIDVAIKRNLAKIASKRAQEIVNQSKGLRNKFLRRVKEDFNHSFQYVLNQRTASQKPHARFVLKKTARRRASDPHSYPAQNQNKDSSRSKNTVSETFNFFRVLPKQLTSEMCQNQNPQKTTLQTVNRDQAFTKANTSHLRLLTEIREIKVRTIDNSKEVKKLTNKISNLEARIVEQQQVAQTLRKEFNEAIETSAVNLYEKLHAEIRKRRSTTSLQSNSHRYSNSIDRPNYGYRNESNMLRPFKRSFLQSQVSARPSQIDPDGNCPSRLTVNYNIVKSDEPGATSVAQLNQPVLYINARKYDYSAVQSQYLQAPTINETNNTKL